MTDTTSPRFVLRNLSLAARLVLALFLISVGVGYFSALVQLHFQHASAGEVIPTAEDTTHAYAGQVDGKGVSQIERLILAHEKKPFTGNGSMRAAFTTLSVGWPKSIKDCKKEHKLDDKAAEARVRLERELEIRAIVEWIRAGAKKEAYDDDEFELASNLIPPELAKTKLKFSLAQSNNKGCVTVPLQTVFRKRCARCHNPSNATSAGDAPLNTYDNIKLYVDKEYRGTGMSLKKLAQTTHVHLLGFAMLYGLTGLIFACTTYPGWLRLILAPLPLLAQLVDIGCWWLARLDPAYTHVILITGGIVAGSLFLQIVLSLFNLFNKVGKLNLLLLIVAAAAGGYVLKEQVIDPYLLREKQGIVAPDE
jgi:hypothetical protein